MVAEPPASDSELNDPEGSPLRSEHTESLTEVLRELGISIAVSTYQAGFVVVLREENGTTNTHFRRFPRPMGMAWSNGRLAVGGAREVACWYNMPDVGSRVEAPATVDACYVPRRFQLTGDIDIHEMAWGRAASGSPVPSTSTDEELWLINTRFSCLCTLHPDFSFVPRWRPKFVSGLSPQDRCHLNGLGLVDGMPKFATALGATDSPRGWRLTKASGGVLIDIPSSEIIAEGLSMPHSPRWYDGRLWLLESGDGSLGTVDLATGKYEAVCQLDGFTRGLDFCGPFAFVGISQVRESAIFSGIPITERLEERLCGMSVVDLRIGKEVAFVRFQDAVQEVFAVQVLPHRYPELLLTGDEIVENTYALPEDWLREVSWQVDPDPS
jgi:uncharacterized protein (TIGR03032 family)